MSRVSFTSEYSDNTQGEKFPKIKLEKGETKRILVLEQPWSEYVHDLRLPEVRDGVLMFEKKKRKDGSEYQVPATVWLANVICLGDKETLKTNGSDPQNCPACAGAQRHAKIPGPKRRYAMNVVEYHMLPNGTLAQPFGAKFIVWAFTARMFDSIIRLSNDHGGMLQNHDLRIGPPEEPVTFQRYPINALPDTAWQAAGEIGFRYLQALNNAPGARATDEQLRDHCGAAKPFGQLQADVERALREWTASEASAAGTQASPFAGQPAFADQAAMSQGFSDLIGQGQQPQFAQGGPVPGANPFGPPAQQPAAASFGQQQFAQPAQVPGASPFGVPPQQPQAAQAPHPLETQAALASIQQGQNPFGAPPQQPQPAAGASPFGPPAQQPQAPQQMQQFAPPAPQPAAGTNPFGPPAQQPQQFAPPAQAAAPGPSPFGNVTPMPGLAEFNQATTMNPAGGPAAAGFAPPPGLAPPGQQGFAQPTQQMMQPPAGQVPGQAPTGDLSFNSFFPDAASMGQQPG